MSIKVVLGLGSNLGDRLDYLNQAVYLLKKSKVIEEVVCSSIYQSNALLKEDSPKEWDLKYLNMAVIGVTKLSPTILLEKTQEIENKLSIKPNLIWSPRDIDIDILAYGEEVINLDELIIPHSELVNRIWALLPFAEIYPDWKYPIKGCYYQLSIKELIEEYYAKTN